MIKYSKVHIVLPLTELVGNRKELRLVLQVSRDRPGPHKWMAAMDREAVDHGESAKWALVALAQQMDQMSAEIKEFADSPEVSQLEILHHSKEKEKEKE